MDSTRPVDAEQLKRWVVSVFERAAPTYGRVGPPFRAHFGRRLAELADIPSGASVLDVATGTGQALVPAAEMARPEGRVVGIDLSRAMVAASREEVARRGLAGATVRRMDAERLRFADESFDRVLCGFALYCFPRPAQALREAWRVLRPGGKLALATISRRQDERWRWYAELWQTYMPPSVRRLLPVIAFDTPVQLALALAGAGFIQVRLLEEDVGFVYADEDEWWADQWSAGNRAFLEALRDEGGADSVERFRANAYSRLRAQKQSAGIPQRVSALFALGTKPS